MLRVAASLIIFCFLTVSIFGTDCGWVCVSACEIAKCPEVEEQAGPMCGSGCFSESEPADSPCPKSHPCGRTDFSSCCSQEPSCTESSCSQNIIPECTMKCTRECIPGKSDCGRCIMPRLDFTLSENKLLTPKMELAVVPTAGGSIGNFHKFHPIDDSRPPGVHPTISSTVLRL